VLTGAAYFCYKAFGSFERKNDIFPGPFTCGRTFILLYRFGQVNLAYDYRRLFFLQVYTRAPATPVHLDYGKSNFMRFD